MALQIREITMPSSKYNIKCPYSMTPTRIVIHNTWNDATAENEIKYMQSNNNQVSFHFAVDDKEAVQGIPLNRNAWHAGDGGSGVGNRQGIAIEICYSKSGGEKFIKAEQNAAELTAKLLKERGWEIDRVTKHQDYSGKYCPHRTLDSGWQRFLNMVSSKMQQPAFTPIVDKPKYADDYEHNGFRFHRAKDFKIVYHDLNKRKYNADTYINGGFFAYFAENKVNFTLPVANLVCDINKSFISDPTKKYLSPYIFGTKLYYGCNNNQTAQFKNKAVSTLVVPKNGNPYISDMVAPPSDCLYAISGVPTVRNGDDVDYYNYVKRQGWDDSCMYGTYRNWLGVRDGEIWVISGKTTAPNYIYGMQFWSKVKDQGFDDIICLDGGGSYYCKIDGKAQTTLGTRSVNNVIMF